jgi:hypothetical protein
MAVTINQEPQAISPVGNYLTFTFDSDQTGQDNFSFYVEVYINSSFHSAHTIFPENSANARIDVSGILRTFVSSNIPSSTIDEDYSNALTEYAIIVYERYGTPPINQASATSTTLQIFNGSLRYPEFTLWDYTAYDPATTLDSLFLTDFPRTEKRYVRFDENLFLASFCTVSAPITLFIQLFDIAGNTIASDSYGLTQTDFTLINVGPQIIVANTTITQNDFDQCYRYYVYIDYSGASNTETYFIYMDQDCTRYDPVRLLWLNKYGVWDSFTFKLLSQESTDVTSSRYEGEPGEWGGSDYRYTLSKGMNRTYHKHAVDKLLINSDWMKEAVQNWLVRELFESPVVYIQQSDGSVELVNVTNANYILKQRRKDGLIQEQILLEKTYISNSQLI